ncbi:hypothetical protein K435DRAFT_916108 [Dendrothele bispora CBS 962.96]|uniref:Uncharacterized protein n=1 Tax=Dendrothele bispora (strain CBS 962.96) TaxID=1314807 RepID=A0A4S8LJ29_DENBC|nr:hypothetical protein K435DRAFT_916108 [Dendrothele bispora CBS 962.96]
MSIMTETEQRLGRTLTGCAKLKQKASVGNDLVQLALDYEGISGLGHGADIAIRTCKSVGRMKRKENDVPTGQNGPTKLSTTAMSCVVAYTSLARASPNHEKGKSKRKGENYEERHNAQFKNPSVPDSDEVDQIHEVDLQGLLKIYGKRKEGQYEKESTVHDPLELNFTQSHSAHLKGNHCKHNSSKPSFLASELTVNPPSYTSNVHLLNFVHNYETPVMKESLETKRKTGQGYVQAYHWYLYLSAPATKNKVDNKAPPQIPKTEKGIQKKFRSVHRLRECELRKIRPLPLHLSNFGVEWIELLPALLLWLRLTTKTRVITLSRVGKVFININGYEYLYAFVV